jgi:hypothetical protein
MTNTKQDCVGVERAKCLEYDDDIQSFTAGVGGKSFIAEGVLKAEYQTAVMPGTSAVVARWMEKDILRL